MNGISSGAEKHGHSNNERHGGIPREVLEEEEGGENEVLRHWHWFVSHDVVGEVVICGTVLWLKNSVDQSLQSFWLNAVHVVDIFVWEYGRASAPAGKWV